MASKRLNNSLQRLCSLKPMQADLPEIVLQEGTNFVGRSEETAIRLRECSKRQLELKVDTALARAKVRVWGLNPSSVNGLMVMQDIEFEARHGDVLEIIYGKLPYELVFKPEPEPTTKEEAIDEEEAAKEDPAKEEPAKKVAKEEHSMEEEPPKAETASWSSVDNGKVLIYTSAGVQARSAIAAYDMDGTLIKTKSGNVFPKDTNDWQLWHPKVVEKLKQLHEGGYKICIFTNQSGISKGKVDVGDFKRKIVAVVARLAVPVQVFIALGQDYYRKPRPGMWENLEELNNAGVKVNYSRSFFVGDAAGRPESGRGVNKRRKDHSLADRLFAQNVGLTFYTPEEHFLNARQEDWNKPEFHPKDVDEKISLLLPDDTELPGSGVEMIIMVGLPGSGKSHFVQEHLKPLQYCIANADTLGGVTACVKACEKALAAKQSCVVDNTNVDQPSRQKFLEIAKRLNVPCRCFVMTPTVAHIRHNITFRELTDSKHSKINDMVFNTMKKKYQSPQLAEGFTQIVRVNVRPCFKDEHHAKLYKLYLAEK